MFFVSQETQCNKYSLFLVSLHSIVVLFLPYLTLLLVSPVSLDDLYLPLKDRSFLRTNRINLLAGLG